MLKTMSNFKQRLSMSTICVLLLIFLIYMSHYPVFRPIFAMFLAGAVSGASWELYHMAKSKGYHPQDTLGLIASAAFIIAAFLGTQDEKLYLLPGTVFLLTLAACFAYYFFTEEEPFINISITIFGLAYLAVPLSCMLQINYLFPLNTHPDGRWWLLYLILVAKMTDTGAYFIGKKMGSHKMAPYISPSKTWEGAIGGFLFGLGSSVTVYYIGEKVFQDFPLTLSQSIWLGGLLSIAAQFGDLAESLLKRDLGAKDSNRLPGLGGLLDMLDSLVFTTPIVYMFLIYHSPD